MNDVADLRVYVLRLARGFLVLFAAMAVWLVYWHVVAAPALRADALNPRARERLKMTQPGRVMTSDGKVVLEGARGQDEWYLDYPGHQTYCHLTGYNLKTGIIPTIRDALYGAGSYEDPWCRVLRGRPTGCEVTLTINAAGQRRATELMAGSRGAVVAIEPSTGAILVAVSAPGYEPAGVLASQADFAAFQGQPDKPELNRALLGQYAPGSVLKVLTAAAALDAGVVKLSDKFECKGKAMGAGTKIICRVAAGHGELGLERAFTDSCNVTFAEVGERLGPQRFMDYVNKFFLLQRPDLPLTARGGRMANMVGPNAGAQVAEAAFGQGATLVTPAAIASLAATIANGGQVPRLQLIQRITGPRGRVFAQMKPEMLGQAVRVETAHTVAGLMEACVERGTGRRAEISGVRVGGKTGSAENPSGLPHAWFAGFAPVDKPRVAVAVIVENGGSGGGIAAPIAQGVIEAILGR